MGKCLDDLRANYSRGLTDAEIEEIFADAKRLWKGVQASRQASNQNALAQQLAAQQAQREQIAAVIKKRNTYLQLERKVAILENTLGNWQGREGEGLSAMMVGGQKLREGSRMSVDALRTGIKGEYVGGFLNDLNDLGPTHYAIFKKGAMDREIAEAMWTIDNPDAQPFGGPKEAMDIAQVAHKWQEKARLDQNRVGGFIGKEPGYIVRQSHDSARIEKAGFDQWRADIEDKLDWTRTGNGRFDPQQNPNFMPQDKADFLFETYENLRTGVHLKETGAPQNPLSSNSDVGSVANKVSQERVLHFKDGGAWFDYNAQYGKGNLREAMLGGFSRAADNTALMQVFGPSPQANLDNSIRFIRESLRKRGDNQRSLRRELYGRGADTFGTALKGAGKGAIASAFLQNRHGEMSNFAGLFVMMTIFGYGAMTAKQLLAGKTPRPPDDLKTWLAAASQGGGLGIYGDFLFGEKSRMGTGPVANMMGPAAGSADSIMRLFQNIRDGEDVGSEAFRLFFNHLPGNNLFYIRAALDYTILNSFYEYLNPGYLRRMRRRVEKENGQTFWLEPVMNW